MKFQKLHLFIILLSSYIVSAQIIDPSTVYRKERDKTNNLIHTKLKVDFNLMGLDKKIQKF